jgi:hypothetical protein
LGLAENETSIWHFVKGCTNREKVGDDFVRLMEVMAEKVGVDL